MKRKLSPPLVTLVVAMFACTLRAEIANIAGSDSAAQRSVPAAWKAVIALALLVPPLSLAWLLVRRRTDVAEETSPEWSLRRLDQDFAAARRHEHSMLFVLVPFRELEATKRAREDFARNFRRSDYTLPIAETNDLLFLFPFTSAGAKGPLLERLAAQGLVPDNVGHAVFPDDGLTIESLVTTARKKLNDVQVSKPVAGAATLIVPTSSRRNRRVGDTVPKAKVAERANA